MPQRRNKVGIHGNAAALAGVAGIALFIAGGRYGNTLVPVMPQSGQLKGIGGALFHFFCIGSGLGGGTPV